MPPSLCTSPGCPFNGRYCRAHSTTATKAKGPLGSKPKKELLTDLQKWFQKKIKYCTWICEECGKPCYSDSSDYQHAVQAHLLPKSHFFSVSTDETNHMVLGAACGCHAKFDKSWMSASKMKVWARAKAIIFELVPRLWPEEYRRLPDVIRDDYEQHKLKQIANKDIVDLDAYVIKQHMKLNRTEAMK